MSESCADCQRTEGVHPHTIRTGSMPTGYTREAISLCASCAGQRMKDWNEAEHAGYIDGGPPEAVDPEA